MLPNTLRRWRLLGVLLLGLASVASFAPAASAATWNPVIVHQDAAVALTNGGVGQIKLAWRVGGHDGDGTAANVTLFQRLTTRGAAESVVNGSGLGVQELATTGLFPLDCRADGVARFSLGLNHEAAPCGGARPTFTFPCTVGTCDGVYPVRFDVVQGSTYRTVWSLVTLTTAPSHQPLNLSWIVHVSAPDVLRAQQEAGVLAALAASPLPAAVTLTYDELATIYFGQGYGYDVLRAALRNFLAAPAHQLLDQGPATTDFGALWNNGQTQDLQQQFRLTDTIATQLSPGFVGTNTVLLQGGLSPASLAALSRVGFNHVLIRESDLRDTASSTLHWGTPFHFANAPHELLAAATDDPLRQLTQRHDLEVGRRAALTVGVASMLYFQAPYATTPRTAVVVSEASQLSPTYVREFLSGVRAAATLRLVSVNGATDPAAVGGNRNPVLRTATGLGTASWTSTNVRELEAVSHTVQSLVSAVSTIRPLLRIERAVLLAETGLASRDDAVQRAQRAVTTELAHFRFDESAVTLAGSGSTLPITLYSTANYSVTGVVELTSDRFRFPSGDHFAVLLSTQTGTLRVPIALRSGVSGVVKLRLTTPNGDVTLATGAVQVRDTSTSAVGYALSLGALFVIFYWWWRTSRKKSTGRHQQ